MLSTFINYHYIISIKSLIAINYLASNLYLLLILLLIITMYFAVTVIINSLKRLVK